MELLAICSCCKRNRYQFRFSLLEHIPWLPGDSSFAWPFWFIVYNYYLDKLGKNISIMFVNRRRLLIFNVTNLARSIQRVTNELQNHYNDQGSIDILIIFVLISPASNLPFKAILSRFAQYSWS